MAPRPVPAASVALTALLCVVYGIATGLISGVSGQVEGEYLLTQGNGLQPNQKLYLGNVYSFVMQEDCNLVLIHTDVGALWDSGTANYGKDCFFVLQADGNGVIYKDNSFRSPVWATQTCCRGDGDHYIVVQADGNVCMYSEKGTGAIWATNTAGRR